MKIELPAYFKCKSESMTEYFKVTTPSGDCQRVCMYDFERGVEWGFIPNYSVSKEALTEYEPITEVEFNDAVLSVIDYLGTLVNSPVVTSGIEAIKVARPIPQYPNFTKGGVYASRPTFNPNTSIKDLMEFEGERQ